MYSNTGNKALVHLPRPQSREPDQHLPRGECRFILPDVDADGSRQRCSCASFSLNDGIPGSQCGCGHQAWHHVQGVSGETVPVEEHMALVDKCKKLEEGMRMLNEDMKKERKEREKIYNNMVQMLRGNYGNMAYLKYAVEEKLENFRVTMEDKIEGVLDRATSASEDVERLKSRVFDLDETSIRLEERMDSGRWAGSRSLTPAVEERPTPKIPSEPLPSTPKVFNLPPISSLPLRSRSQEKVSEAWNCRAILIPKKTQRFAFQPESIAHYRCQSRGLHQDIHLQDKNSESFIRCIEAAFQTILKGRPWMPLQCLRSSDMSLGQLIMEHRNPVLWNYAFLESQCMAHDKLQGDVIYLALMHEELGWPDIHSLPRLFGSDETCWDLDEELDGKAAKARMDYKMDVDRIKSLETDSMYEYSPPPYSSSRTHTEGSRLPTALDVLAGTASYLAHSSAAPSISDRSTFSDRSIDTTLYEEDDEHRDKRNKLGPLRPQPQPHGLSPSIPNSPPSAQKMYYSGRAKRKINPAKQKEPLDWRVSEMKIANPMKGMFHRKHGESKDDHSSEIQRSEQDVFDSRTIRSM